MKVVAHQQIWLDVCGLTAESNPNPLDIPGIRYRIIKHLPAYLLKFGSVDLRQVGRFRLVGHNASIDYNAAVVYPPYYDVAFEAHLDDNAEDYIHYLSQRLGLDDALIAEVMSTYTNVVRQSLDNLEPVSLEGLGILIKTSQADTNFESDEAYWGKSAVAELAVAFTPVPHLKDQATKQQISSLDKEPIVPEAFDLERHLEFDKNEVEEVNLEEDWQISEDDKLVSEIEFVADVSESTDDEMKDLIEDDDTSSALVSPAVPIEVEAQTAAESTRVEPRSIDHEADTIRPRPRYVLPLLIALLCLVIPLTYYLLEKNNNVSTELDRTDVPVDRVNKSPIESEGTTYPVEETTTVSQDDSDRGLDENKEVEASKEEHLPEDRLASSEQENTKDQKIKTIDNSNSGNTSSVVPGKCVIIVGAFGQGPNMRKMMSKLESKGYSVYVDSARSLSRVGVYSECGPSELQSNLRTIQSQIEPKSWVLNQ